MRQGNSFPVVAGNPALQTRHGSLAFSHTVEIIHHGVDSTGRPYRIEFERAMWHFEVIAGERRVGHAWCGLQGEVLRMADLLIYKNAPIWNKWQKVRGILGWGAKTEDFRGAGLGSALLAAIICQAEAAGIARIEGCITSEDLRQFPKLTDWYEKHGFLVRSNLSPPSGASLLAGSERAIPITKELLPHPAEPVPCLRGTDPYPNCTDLDASVTHSPGSAFNLCSRRVFA